MVEMQSLIMEITNIRCDEHYTWIILFSTRLCFFSSVTFVTSNNKWLPKSKGAGAGPPQRRWR